MNAKALILTGASVGVAVVTLVALNLIAPISHAEETHPQGISADAVFGASISEPGASAPSPSAAAPAAIEVAVADTAAVTTGQESAPVETASAFSAEPTMEVAAMQEESVVEPVVEEPAMEAGEEPATSSSSAGSCSAAEGVSGAPVVVKAAGYPGDGDAAPTESGDVASAPAAAPAEPVVSDNSSFSEPAAEAAPAPKPKAKAKPKAPKVAPPEAKLAWWPAKTDGKLNLTYAGEASFTKAIVLLFDGNFETPESANQNIKVTAKDGSAVAGQWLVAKGNPQMLLFNVAPGLYKVSVGSGLSDKGGRALGAASSGQVFVP